MHPPPTESRKSSQSVNPLRCPGLYSGGRALRPVTLCLPALSTLIVQSKRAGPPRRPGRGTPDTRTCRDVRPLEPDERRDRTTPGPAKAPGPTVDARVAERAWRAAPPKESGAVRAALRPGSNRHRQDISLTRQLHRRRAVNRRRVTHIQLRAF
ncbi:hypothetical protein M8J77_004859 [Diaphorina citri]|nr:hypothetical protein M8J77_004859 [Diaphorina citri]